MERPPFPSVIDSTMMAAIRSCQRKAELEYILHWKTKAQSIHLHAGAAYAKGLEVARTEYYLKGRPQAEAEAIGLAALTEAYGDFTCPPDSAKSLERMCGAFEFYTEQYPMGSDTAVPVSLPGDRRGIEFSFSEPMDVLHPETGDPLLYCGRMDMVVNYASQIFGEDDKTTSTLGPSWSKQWDLRSQFTGYCWGAGRANLPLAGFIIRGVSILKTKYDTQQAITYRPQWQIDRWYEQTCRDLERFKKAWQEGYYDYSLDHACNEYSGCPFRQVCLSPAPEKWLELGFEKRVWNPVTREETVE